MYISSPPKNRKQCGHNHGQVATDLFFKQVSMKYTGLTQVSKNERASA
jgi:hypothetical protein